MLEDKNYVYMIQIDYSTNDYQGVQSYLFRKREDALKSMMEIIENEKRNSWVADVFDNNNLDSDYELDTNIEDENADYDLWWNITCKDNFYLHTFIDLRLMEIK